MLCSNQLSYIALIRNPAALQPAPALLKHAEFMAKGIQDRYPERVRILVIPPLKVKISKGNSKVVAALEGAS